MTNIDVIENKISYLLKRLAGAKKFQSSRFDDLQKDDVLKSAVERELYVIAQAVVDVAEATVALKNLRKPTTMREGIEILGEAGILPKEFIKKFIGLVGFRNALAHDYEDLNLEVVYDVLQNKLTQVEEFITYLQAAIR